jgi:hypothetical protein
MAEIPRLPISEILESFSPAFVLGTTYTISLAFFEGLVFPQIRKDKLRRCLLLCDRVGFHTAILEAPALRKVSQEYMAACTPSRYSFHPKVWLMIGEDKAALLVGSGNLTQSGIMDNAELFDAVFLEKGGAHRQVAEDVIIFLSGLRGLWAGRDGERLLCVETLREIEDAMNDLAAGMTADEESDVRFLTSFHGPLGARFAEYFEGGGSLLVAAPYFGGSIAGISSLQRQLSPAQIKVFPAVHPDRTIDISPKKLADIPGVLALPLALGESEGRFCHLKLYGFDSQKGQWIFTTSANCTLAALEGQNVEAGLMRRAKKAWLKQYFAPARGEDLPTKQRANSHGTGDRVLLLWASDRTGAIELVTAEQDGVALPLQDVELTLQVGGEKCRHDAPSLFEHGHVERIPWEWFPHESDRGRSTPVLTVRALTATGLRVEGSAFIDHPLLLTSDPLHRSAWRATLALLDTAGLPEAADLYSIFNLVHAVFDDEDLATPTPEGAPQPGGGRQLPAAPDKIAIWPPEPDNSGPSHFPHGSRVHTLRWFQAILAELLHRPAAERGDPDYQDANDADDERNDRDEFMTSPRIRRAAQGAWGHAKESFTDLIRRLDESEITAAAAPKIWPVSVAILLVALATRRQCQRAQNAGISLPSAETLLNQFVWSLFKDRFREFGLDEDSGRVPTLPSVAEVLHNEFAADPAEDIADMLILLFASLHVRGERSGYNFPLNEWLVLRDLAPQAVASAASRKEEFRPAAQRFFADASEGLTAEQIIASLESLQARGWEGHPGLRELRALSRRVQGTSSDGASELPPPLQRLWYMTEARLRRRKPWLIRVSRYAWSCGAPDCPDNATLDPRKRVLWELRPTICSTCGAVLVPDRLADQLEDGDE